MKEFYYRKKPIQVHAYQTDKELNLPITNGILHASINDYIITNGNDTYPCKPDIFEKTYDYVKDDIYQKKVIVIKAYQTDEEKIIDTLEGPVIAKVGDYVVTGVNGEQYPIEEETFNNLYDIIKGENLK